MHDRQRRVRGRSAPARDRERLLDGVSTQVQRLAVLLEGGVSPVRAWGYLGEPRSAVTFSLASTVATAAVAGVPIDRAIAAAARVYDSRTRQAWNTVAAAWLVATDSGAPLAGCLRDLSKALVELADVQRSIEVARAAPAATSRLMTALPLVGLAFGALLGFDTVGTLVGTAPGVVCLCGGAVLLLISSRWSSFLVRTTLPRATAAGLPVELMAIAMSGGCSVSRARQITLDALNVHDLAHRDDHRRVDSVIELSRRAGVPAAELLRAEGAHERREALTLAQKRAAALSVRLMLPLAFCVLPAFMLLGVAPLLISVVTSTFSSF